MWDSFDRSPLERGTEPLRISNLPPEKRAKLAMMFSSHPSTFLIDTVLEGRLGTARVDNIHEPQVAMLKHADVVVLGGNWQAPSAAGFVQDIPYDKGLLRMPDPWMASIQNALGDELIPIERTPFSSKALDIDHCQYLIRGLPQGFDLRRMDLDLAERIWNNPALISEDHVRMFPSPQAFIEQGVGFCVLQGERIVCGASSYAVCSQGIEVQVNTDVDYRGKGLATVASAALVDYCLERGIDPHWDAGNPISFGLAQKLGYIPLEPYTMFVRVQVS